MLKICAVIIHLLIVALVFLVVTRAEYSEYYDVTESNDTSGSDRHKRSPDIFPERLEAMIIEENGEFIHLKWEKVEQTLFNEHTPIWTAKRNTWGTYHTLQPNLMKIMGNFKTYHDIEQKSAVMSIKGAGVILGQVDLIYQLVGLPVRLLRQCHRAGSNYVQILGEPPHGKIRRVRPQQSDIDRFENCGNLPSEPVPCTSGDCGTSTGRRVVKRDANLEQYNVTKIRRRRDRKSEELYIETLVLVKYDTTAPMKKRHMDKYLSHILLMQLMHFNMIDVLLAQLRTHNLNIHVNIAGIIVEDDEYAFHEVIKLPQYSGHVTQMPETDDKKYARYLKYHDLPFDRDSVDLIYISTSSLPFLISHAPHIPKASGLTFHNIDLYKTRQVYKDAITVPLTLTYVGSRGQSECTGAHEITHVLQVLHDELNLNDHLCHPKCHGLMQPYGPSCFNCINFSAHSLKQLREYTRLNKDHCFLLNFPRSLYPPGPRKSLSPCQQCHCYGYRYYGERAGECLLRIPADGCAKPLQCQHLDSGVHLMQPTILPLDGTPCGNHEVCWNGDCVKVRRRAE